MAVSGVAPVRSATGRCKATIQTASQMGVVVKMVTGDQLAIAQETAKKLGMGTSILDASFWAT